MVQQRKRLRILGRDRGPYVFDHYSSIQLDGYKNMKVGDPLEFDVIQGVKSTQADQVRRIPQMAVEQSSSTS